LHQILLNRHDYEEKNERVKTGTRRTRKTKKRRRMKSLIRKKSSQTLMNVRLSSKNFMVLQDDL
jgi:hypothetical protein